MGEKPLLQIDDLDKYFPVGGGILSKPRAWVKAVEGVSFSVRRGESFGVVGESGCGKTTLGRLIMRLVDPTGGRILFDGRDITRLDRKAMRSLRHKMQIIFQDPYSSLDPRMKIDAIVTEPLAARGKLNRQRRTDIGAQLLERVGLSTADLYKYPHEFSGGQRQRIGIARALSVQPEMIVADEPVSALDVSIQAQVINLLKDLKSEYHLSLIFISHDLSVVTHLCDRIVVMYFGQLVEMATRDMFIRRARHPYTRALLSSVPLPDPHVRSGMAALQGDVPDPMDPPRGCPFHPRCQYVHDLCREKRPPFLSVAHQHYAACWLNDGRGLEGE
jgi:oligopeptide/dipeptide ABC transporter ATP-binding protein